MTDLTRLHAVGGARAAAADGPRAGRGEDRAVRGRGRRGSAVPAGGAGRADRRRPARHAHPRGVRRRGRRRARHRDRHRGGRPRLRVLLADPGGEQARHGAAAAVRLRGAQAEVPAAGRARRGDVLLRAVRGGRGLRRGRHEDPGGARRRLVGAERHQDVDHQRGGVAVLHGDGGDRPVPGRARHLGLRGGEGRPGGQLRPAGEEARHQGLAHPQRHPRRTRGSRPTGSSAPRAPASRPRWPPWTTPGSPSRPRRSASPRARSTTRSATSSSAGSSASRSPISRASSSCWPTWP